MGSGYNEDVIAWSIEQAALLRSGKFSELDIENIAAEIESVGKSEQREFTAAMSGLMQQFLIWQYFKDKRTPGLQRTIKELRKIVSSQIKKTPSLKTIIEEDEWRQVVWSKAVASAFADIESDKFPEICPWSIDQVLNAEL